MCLSVQATGSTVCASGTCSSPSAKRHRPRRKRNCSGKHAGCKFMREAAPLLHQTREARARAGAGAGAPGAGAGSKHAAGGSQLAARAQARLAVDIGCALCCRLPGPVFCCEREADIENATSTETWQWRSRPTRLGRGHKPNSVVCVGVVGWQARGLTAHSRRPRVPGASSRRARVRTAHRHALPSRSRPIRAQCGAARHAGRAWCCWCFCRTAKRARGAPRSSPAASRGAPRSSPAAVRRAGGGGRGGGWGARAATPAAAAAARARAAQASKPRQAIARARGARRQHQHQHQCAKRACAGALASGGAR